MTTVSSAQKEVPPDVVDLGIGQPSPGLLPFEVMAKASEHAMTRRERVLLSYGFEQGDGAFRTALAGFLETIYGGFVDPGHLLVTNGASQALDLICTLFARPGDAIFIEEPTYFLALKIFADHHLDPVSIPMDAEGLDVDALEHALKRRKPSFLYTIPTYHNPTSVCLSAERRERLAELSRKYDLLVVADEVYHPLAYTALPPPPMAGFCRTANIISLGSFSKILAPGLRLGWLQAAPAVIRRMIGCGLLDSGGGLNPFTSGIVASAIELGLLAEHLGRLKDAYRLRMQAMAAALGRHLPDRIEFKAPEGGFFIWVKLLETVDTRDLFDAARERKVEFMPGMRFSALGGLTHCLRLSFAFYDTPELLKGVERLAAVIKKQRLRP